MSKLDWDSIIPELPTNMEVGEETKLEHCKPGKRKLSITRTNYGYVGNCYLCGDSGAVRHSVARTSSEKGSGRPVDRTVDHLVKSSKHRPFTLPSDTRHANTMRSLGEPAVTAYEWLRQYLDPGQLARSSINWSDYHQSLIFPIIGVIGELIGYQSRRFPESKPKYMSFWDDRADRVILPFNNEAEVIVLVEDYLSAFKVSLTGKYAALPLLGVNLTSAQVSSIVGTYSKAIVALDNDNPQVKLAQAELAWKLQGYIQVAEIYLYRDLKECDLEEIERILNDDPIPVLSAGSGEATVQSGEHTPSEVHSQGDAPSPSLVASR